MGAECRDHLPSWKYGNSLDSNSIVERTSCDNNKNDHNNDIDHNRDDNHNENNTATNNNNNDRNDSDNNVNDTNDSINNVNDRNDINNNTNDRNIHIIIICNDNRNRSHFSLVGNKLCRFLCKFDIYNC